MSCEEIGPVRESKRHTVRVHPWRRFLSLATLACSRDTLQLSMTPRTESVPLHSSWTHASTSEPVKLKRTDCRQLVVQGNLYVLEKKTTGEHLALDNIRVHLKRSGPTVDGSDFEHSL